MSSINATIDDFDSVIQYDDLTHWQSPDPSNKDSGAAAVAAGYAFGTFHSTTVPNASFSLNYTGSDIYIYGSTGPNAGKYDIEIDNGAISFTGDANASQNTSSSLLFNSTNSPNPTAPHTIKVTNRGNAGQEFVFDYLQTTFQIAASGATATNTTVEENDARVTYSGVWGHNTSPLFPGGVGTFTSAEGASASLSFNGSAIYAFGDTNANHGFYTVTLDGGSPILLKSVTGCGLPYQPQGVCERTVPNLIFFAPYLDASEHKITFTNVAGVNNTFFDLNRFVFTQPSQFFVPPVNNGSGTPSGSNGPSSPASPTSPTSHSGQDRIIPQSGLCFGRYFTTLVLSRVIQTFRTRDYK